MKTFSKYKIDNFRDFSKVMLPFMEQWPSG